MPDGWQRRLQRVTFLVGVVGFGTSLVGGLALLGATGQFPGVAPDPLLRARALLRRGQTKAAIAEYSSAAAIAPDFDALLELAFAQAQAGDPIGEGEAYRRALSLRPGAPSVRLGLGWALAKQGRLDEAASWFQEALELEPGSGMAHAGLGEVRLAQRKLDLAIASLSRAAELAPDSVAVHNNLGQAFLLSGRAREAVQQFETAYRLAPEPQLLASLRRAQEMESAPQPSSANGPARAPSGRPR